MGKFYSANEELKSYLLELGLTFHDREDTTVDYLTDHKTGKQVKIDNHTKLVSLMDNRGETIDISSCFTDNQINKFLVD